VFGLNDQYAFISLSTNPGKLHIIDLESLTEAWSFPYNTDLGRRLTCISPSWTFAVETLENSQVVTAYRHERGQPFETRQAFSYSYTSFLGSGDRYAVWLGKKPMSIVNDCVIIPFDLQLGTFLPLIAIEGDPSNITLLNSRAAVVRRPCPGNPLSPSSHFQTHPGC